MTFLAGQRLTAAALNAALASVPQLIQSSILSSSQASIIINVPSGYNHLQCVFTVKCDAGSAQFVRLRLNGDTSSNYTWERLTGNNTTVAGTNATATDTSIEIGVTSSAADTANYFGVGGFTVGNIASAVFKPVASYFQGSLGAANAWTGTAGGIWLSTSAVTSVTVFPASGNFIAGSSLSIYGWQ